MVSYGVLWFLGFDCLMLSCWGVVKSVEFSCSLLILLWFLGFLWCLMLFDALC